MEEEKMDINWIETFEEEEKYYTMFYPEKIKEITVNILYINKNKELEKISEKILNLTNENIIKKEELIKLIKENEKIDKEKYKLINILVYNFDINNDELKNFLSKSDNYDFITNLKSLDDYELKSTINCLHTINNIYIILIQEDKKINATTKRVKFNLLHKKTRKKNM